MAEEDSAPAKKQAKATYGGVIGAFPYAYRESSSRLFRSYVVLGGLLTALTILIFTSSVITLLADTFRTTGGTFTFSRSFFVVVALAVVGPLLAPVLLVARRHRRQGSRPQYDVAMASSGYLLIASLYVGLVISAPPGARDRPPALLAPVVEALYSLPPVVGLVPPLLAVGVMYWRHRRFGDGAGEQTS